MSKKLDFEKATQKTKMSKQGTTFLEPDLLSEKQKAALEHSREKIRKANKRRIVRHQKSLVSNLEPMCTAQLKRQISGLEGMIETLPNHGGQKRRQFMERELKRLRLKLVRKKF
ncbi:hypothetical protein K3X13_00635 [Aliiroseovarius crassostreae]|uniref:hypothetical protein n=1 Tax=Aliiroseovarius crassostreae TaxID=154981 RepID=UPI002208E989|nr:hypothetical protein [Aliiroseovarius crassostreae]UWP92408.1 hypothetical protein K3X13_00635 [Aliiroseovarius crassostreae]